MRWALRILAGAAALAALFLAVGLLLPRSVNVSRSVVIDAPADVVWPYVSDLRRFNEWSPWASIDPDGTGYEFTGPQAGAGQIMRWSSGHPNVGSGIQEIVAVDPGRSVETRLEFADMGTAHASLTLTPNGDATEVTWTFATDLGINPLSRWIGLMFDTWVGNDYEKGLAKLQRIAGQEAARGG